MPIRSRTRSIMGQIEPEDLASTNINQSTPDLVKIYVIIRSRMSSIMDLIGPELSELSALEFGKFAIFDFVYQTRKNLD